MENTEDIQTHKEREKRHRKILLKRKKQDTYRLKGNENKQKVRQRESPNTERTARNLQNNKQTLTSMKQEALTFIGTHTQTSQRYANYITRHTHTHTREIQTDGLKQINIRR